MSFKTGFTLRFTGISEAHKTALSHAVAEILRNRGYRVKVLDGGEVGRSDGLTFSKEDRDRKYPTHRVSPNLLSRNGAGAIAADIPRNRPVPEEVPRQTQEVEAYVTCSLQAVIQRDGTGVRFTRLVLNEGPSNSQSAELVEAPFRTVSNYRKRSSKHERGGFGDCRHRPARPGGRIGDRLKVGVIVQAVRQFQQAAEKGS